MNVEEIMKSSSTKVSPRASPRKESPNLKSPRDITNLAKEITSPSKSSGLKTPSTVAAVEVPQKAIQNDLLKSQSDLPKTIKDAVPDKETKMALCVSKDEDQAEKAATVIDIEDKPKDGGMVNGLEKESLIKSEAPDLGDSKGGSEQMKSDGDSQVISTISTVQALPAQISDVGNALPTADIAPILPTRKFTKNFSSGSVVSAMSAGSGPLKGWSEGEGNDPPIRQRKNLLLSMKSKRAFHVEVDKTIEDALLFQTLRPLMFCMKLSGIFFIRKKGQFGKTFREVLRSCTALQIYCLSMCGLLFLNFLRSMVAFDPNDGFSNALFLKFLTAIFMYESVSIMPQTLNSLHILFLDAYVWRALPIFT